MTFRGLIHVLVFVAASSAAALHAELRSADERMLAATAGATDLSDDRRKPVRARCAASGDGSAPSDLILFPLDSLVLNGALGDEWTVDTSVFNSGSSSIVLGMPPTGSVRVLGSGETWTKPRSGGIMIASSQIEDVFVGTVVSDGKRSVGGPSVRPEDWSQARAAVVGIPFEPDWRYRLLTVGPPGVSGPLKIRIVDERSGSVFAERTACLGPSIPFSSSFVASLTAAINAKSFRVEVDTSPDISIWILVIVEGPEDLLILHSSM